MLNLEIIYSMINHLSGVAIMVNYWRLKHPMSYKLHDLGSFQTKHYNLI
jgi:hypothetical protein